MRHITAKLIRGENKKNQIKKKIHTKPTTDNESVRGKLLPECSYGKRGQVTSTMEKSGHPFSQVINLGIEGGGAERCGS